MPADQQSNVSSEEQTQDNGQSGNGYMNPNDLFNYFFGNRYSGSSYRRNG